MTFDSARRPEFIVIPSRNLKKFDDDDDDNLPSTFGFGSFDSFASGEVYEMEF